MSSPQNKNLHRVVLLLSAVLVTGCAEGPLARFGGMNPWVRKKWAEEEQIVESLYGRREKLRELAELAGKLPPDQQEQISSDLANLVRHDPIVLLRIEAVRALTGYNTYTALVALRDALRDTDADVRIAACHSLAERQEPDSVMALQQVVGSDTDLDVRLAATRALGEFRGQKAVQALGIALNDSDPALQYAAMNSLQTASGRNYGFDVVAWRDFANGGNPPGDRGPSFVSRLRNLF